MIKRVFDLVSATVGLVVLSPVMAVIAVLIKRDSEGPVIFKQERVGLGGRRFTLFKFRTMAVAPRSTGPLVTAVTDPRITRVGARLRSSKLDELPQLVNVVLGDMSIVGPRPEVPEYVELWPEEERKIVLSVRPGITDPATVNLRWEEELLALQQDPIKYYEDCLLPEKASLYAEYVRTRSFASDLRILMRTLTRVLRRRSPDRAIDDNDRITIINPLGKGVWND